MEIAITKNGKKIRIEAETEVMYIYSYVYIRRRKNDNIVKCNNAGKYLIILN